jgi:tetratricopeptide (TPR) repeat protein
MELARQYRAQLAGGGELDIRSPQQDLADTLVSEGSELGNAGRIEEATAKFEEVLRRFGQADYPALQLHVAQAGYNRGAALRLSGRPREAVDAFAEVLRRYRGSSDQALRAQCAITLFNQGIALQDDGRTQEAVDTLAEVVADYRDDEHPATRERVARALAVRADLLWELGRLAEAVATRAEVLRRFADAPEPAVREAVAAARQEQAGLLPPEPPARGRGGAAATYSEADTGLDLGRLAEEVPEVHIHGVYSFIEPKPARMSRRERRRHERDLKEGVRRQQARDARLHEQAEQVLSEYRTRGRPFALFLRNFDLEAYQARSRAGGVLIVQQDEPGDVEAKLAAALRGRLPVIGIANPSLVRPDFEHPIPKLLIADEHWRDVLSRLLLAADLVVMHLEQVTPGVAAELAAILELQRQDVVVIVLRSRPAEEQQDALAEGLMSVHGIDRPQAGTPGPELLRRFPRVVLADEVPFEQLDASPPFAELLARIDALSASGR